MKDLFGNGMLDLGTLVRNTMFTDIQFIAYFKNPSERQDLYDKLLNFIFNKIQRNPQHCKVPTA